MVWQFRQVLEQADNAVARETVQRILARHEALLSHYQQWAIVEVEA